jgi:Spy/CpxP family protein refolding chaperone
MKKSLSSALLALLLAGSTAIVAQAPSGQWGPGGGQPPTVDQRLQRMSQMLELTGDQQEKIKPILENEDSQMQTLRADTLLSQQDRFAKMKEIRENTASQVNPILNPDQQKKYAEMMSRMGRGRGPGAPNTSTPAQPPPQQ